MQIQSFRSLALVGIIGVGASIAWADQNAGQSSPVNMTAELKMDMADMYQKMATCLRSRKTVPQCNQEVMKDCPVIKKTGHCPIIEGMDPILGKR